jgi:hypothetical protein
MADKLMKWSIDGLVLKVTRFFKEMPKEVKVDAEFDLAKLWDVLKDEANVEFRTHALTYLTKQRLSDAGASEKADYGGKVQVAKDRWEDMLQAKWGGERLNGTGAAENKRLAGEVKSVRANLTPDKAVGMYLTGMSLTQDEQKLLLEPSAQKMLKALGRTFPEAATK